MSRLASRVQLTHGEDRPLEATEIEKLWRERLALCPMCVSRITTSSTSAGGGAKISLALYGPDPDELTAAGVALQNKLGEYDGVFDIYNSQGVGGREF